MKALTEDGHEGQLYELTGPRLLTLAEAAAELGPAEGGEGGESGEGEVAGAACCQSAPSHSQVSSW